MATRPVLTPHSFSDLPRRALIAFIGRTARRALPLFGDAWPGAPEPHSRAVQAAVYLAEDVGAGRAMRLAGRPLADRILTLAGRVSAGANAAGARVSEKVADAAYCAPTASGTTTLAASPRTRLRSWLQSMKR
jgi:hypothetical protein